jgi:hypothetical protein
LSLFRIQSSCSADYYSSGIGSVVLRSWLHSLLSSSHIELVSALFYSRLSEERRQLFLISSLGELLVSPTSPSVDHALFSEILAFLKQDIWMKLLTEGELYIVSLSTLLSDTEQCIFDTINNLGSFLPRSGFSTFEESVYTCFQQTLSNKIE